MGSIFKPGKKYSFSDYFELNQPTKEIIAEFGYEYHFEPLILPEANREVSIRERLRDMYLKKLPLISLTSEAAKREFYIAPLLLELLDYTRAEIDVEYPLDAGENLSGNIDYLLKYAQQMVIIEAKKGDLERGFNQLAVELIALDKVSPATPHALYGAVTLGDVWRFGMLDREAKTLKKDMHVYTLLADVEKILSTLIGILETVS